MTSPIPAWLDFARTLHGVAEVPGPRHNPTILSWWKALGVKVLGLVATTDEIAWCGVYVAWCMRHVGIDPPPIAARAKAWATWGQPCTPGLGAILVFGRTGGGHVGFYEGERADAYLVLGGNQGNRVSKQWIAKDRLLAARWPATIAVNSRPVKMGGTGAVSRNEA